MPGEYYLWSVDDKPVRVQFSLSVIERLGAIVIENFRLSPENPRECFGVLLGRSRKEGRTHVVTVEDFETFDAPPATLETIREQEPIGLFRGRPSGDMRLDPEDASGIERLFQRPEQFYLLIQPQAGAPARAGVFIQEKGSLQGYATYREFPFHAALLRETAYPISDGRPSTGRAGMGAALLALTLIICAAGFYAAHRNSTPAAAPVIVATTTTPTVVKPSPSDPDGADEQNEADRAMPKNTKVNSPHAITTVSFEPLAPGKLSRVFGKFRRARFTPPRPVARPLLNIPGSLAAQLHTETPVTLKLRVDKSGRVSDLEVLQSPTDPEFMRLATRAAEKWRFEPARMNQRAVGSEVVARFRFRPVDNP